MIYSQHILLGLILFPPEIILGLKSKSVPKKVLSWMMLFRREQNLLHEKLFTTWSEYRRWFGRFGFDKAWGGKEIWSVNYGGRNTSALVKVLCVLQELHWTSCSGVLTCSSIHRTLIGCWEAGGWHCSSVFFTGEFRVVRHFVGSSQSQTGCRRSVTSTTFWEAVLSILQFLPVPSAILWHDGSSSTRAGQHHGRPEVDGVLGVLDGLGLP